MSSPRRVLFVTHNFPRTPEDAAGGFLLDLARAIRSAGVAVDVIAPHAPGLDDQDFVDGIQVARVRYADEAHETLAYTGTMAEQVKGSLRGKRTMASLLAALKRAVRDRILCGDVSLVHAHWWFPAALAVRGVVHRHRLPLVVTSHGSDARLATGLMAHLATLALRDAAAVTTVSRWLADRLRPLTPAPITVAPMPADVMAFAPKPEARTSAPTLLFVGRLNQQKNLRTVLDALPLLPPELVLEVVGDGPDAGALRARAADLGISARVHWHGRIPRDEVPALAVRAWATVVPSHDEGFGLVAAESLLCGTPVIAAQSGGLTDIVSEGETGHLVSRIDDPAAWAQTIRAFLESPSRDSMGRAGRLAMESLVSPRAVAARYLAVYDAALRSAARAA